MARDAYPIEISYEATAEFCQRHQIRRLSLFGSVLRGDFSPDSDVDVLVEFKEGYQPGIEFFDIGLERDDLSVRRVDFLTRAWIHEGLLPPIPAGI